MHYFACYPSQIKYNAEYKKCLYLDLGLDCNLLAQNTRCKIQCDYY